MTFDYKKEYKDLYQPSKKPSLITVPPMNYVAVRGKGDPSEEGGAYQQALQVLYGLSFTIKMAPKAGVELEGYFPYVVPPLEGFWSQAEAISDSTGIFDPMRKDQFEWISCIRLPDFATPEMLEWAKEEAARKKRKKAQQAGEIPPDFACAEFLTTNEGLCVQCLYVGPYDDEPATIEALDRFAQEQGYHSDHTNGRQHHEIYLSDPRRVAPERLKTVIRIPVA